MLDGELAPITRCVCGGVADALLLSSVFRYQLCDLGHCCTSITHPEDADEIKRAENWMTVKSRHEIGQIKRATGLYLSKKFLEKSHKLVEVNKGRTT